MLRAIQRDLGRFSRSTKESLEEINRRIDAQIEAQADTDRRQEDAEGREQHRETVLLTALKSNQEVGDGVDMLLRLLRQRH